MNLPSIHDLKPNEIGGRIARKGFNYQDHVGVYYLLKMLLNLDIKKIWFEGEDDIVILWNINNIDIVEMIQVKSNNLPSRWSIAKLLEDEVLEKSLKRGRCDEKVIYRIATLYDVDGDLEILKNELSSENRAEILIKELAKKITSKKTIPKNEKGQGVREWFATCVWEKFPDSIDALESQNKLRLEKYLIDAHSKILPHDVRDEIYQKFLMLIYNASISEIKNHFTKDEIEIWLDDLLFNIYAPKRGSEKLIEKMQAANIDNTVIEAAKEMKYEYIFETLNHEYVGQKTINKFKLQALDLLMMEKIKLDNGYLDMTSSEFHSHCLLEIEKLGGKLLIENTISKGCMYDITNRCIHRFTKLTA